MTKRKVKHHLSFWQQYLGVKCIHITFFLSGAVIKFISLNCIQQVAQVSSKVKVKVLIFTTVTCDSELE